MKTLNWITVLIILLSTSCGEPTGEESGAGTADAATELPAALQRGTTTIDLSEHFVKASLIIPDSMRGVPTIEPNAFGGIQVTVGPTYNVVIEKLVGGSLQSKIKALQEDLMYKNEIIEQGDDFIFYKSVIADSYVDPEFHFYAIKQMGGVTYEMHDYNEEGGYAESVARFMLESVSYIQANGSES
jgi:hypothetical protein